MSALEELLKFYWMLMDMCLTKFHLVFIKVKQVQIVLTATQTLHVLIFFKKEKFCLLPSLKFTLSDVTWFPPDNLSRLKKYIQA